MYEMLLHDKLLFAPWQTVMLQCISIILLAQNWVHLSSLDPATVSTYKLRFEFGGQIAYIVFAASHKLVSSDIQGLHPSGGEKKLS